MKTRSCLFIAAVILLSPVLFAQQQRVQVPFFGPGGGITAGATYRVHHTVGTAMTGSVSGPAFRLQSGFWAGTRGLTLDVENEDLPTEFRMYQNYPNPFNPSTTIRYELPMTVDVEIRVYDALGREVRTLVKELQASGRYDVIFEPRNLASGVYFYRIRAGTFVATKKLVHLR